MIVLLVVGQTLTCAACNTAVTFTTDLAKVS